MWSLPASLHLPGVAPMQPRKSSAGELDNRAAITGRGASILGVGHFTVPPDVSVEDPAGAPGSNGDVESWSTIRTIVVPHGIAAVPRRSPIKARNRTPWHSAEPHGVVVRAGRREWFTDRLFVESKQAYSPAAYAASVVVQGVIVILVLLLLATRAARVDMTPRTYTDVSLRMPAALLLMPVAVALPPARKSVEHPSPAPPSPRPAPRPAPAIATPAAAPIETPSGVEAEPTKLDDASPDGVAVSAAADGATDGVAGGVAGGTGSEPSITATLPEVNGPFRVGGQITQPRKIKDVRPVYPEAAMLKQVRGSVFIEATIGADGRVHDARVLRSVGPLEQAALDAVRRSA
jgi:hypothetical protein